MVRVTVVTSLLVIILFSMQLPITWANGDTIKLCLDIAIICINAFTVTTLATRR